MTNVERISFLGDTRCFAGDTDLSTPYERPGLNLRGPF